MHLRHVFAWAALAVATCSAPRLPVASTERGAACDSAQAARLTLDSLDRVAPFRSKIHRLTSSPAGIQITTMPADAKFLDGMARISVTPDCRIKEVVWTDSA